MESFFAHHEGTVRLCFFFGMLLFMGLWESYAPRRKLLLKRWLRWLNNLGLVVLNTLLLRILFPAAAAGIAAVAATNGWGILNQIPISTGLAIVISVILLDFAIWLQHVVFHAIPVLWRLHRVHHADLDYDVTTGLRFHPIEIILSMLIKFAVILVLGPPVVAVILFEIILNACAMFNHGNVSLPPALDKALRFIIVTPDMHRIHHSTEDDEANSNFGFNLTWWDRLLGTYKETPREGQDGMTIGIRAYRAPREVAWLTGLLALPFRGKISGYAINRRQWQDNPDE